jgi:hypothetical protein
LSSNFLPKTLFLNQALIPNLLAECFQQNTLQRAADYDMKTQDNKGSLLQNFCRKVKKTEVKNRAENREVEGVFSAEFFFFYSLESSFFFIYPYSCFFHLHTKQKEPFTNMFLEAYVDT